MDDCRGQCNLRIYCDNDKRWVSRASGGWLDSSNMMAFPAAWGSPLCRQEKIGFGELHRIKAPDPAPVNGKASPLAGQQANRAVMTICDNTFDKYPKDNNAPKKLSDYGQNKDLTQLDISHFQFMISMTILHEWTHHPQFTREDEPQGACYGWENILKMTRDQSVKNSDSYAYLGAWALLAGRPGPQSGYTLPRVGNPPDATKEQECKDGKLALYHQITRKRWLKGMYKRFIA
ncbi:MAG: hypothetical protein Q9160_003429 [Pyrenula sp. 1 TL-2023]